jgi:hypothetical protein
MPAPTPKQTVRLVRVGRVVFYCTIIVLCAALLSGCTILHCEYPIPYAH